MSLLAFGLKDKARKTRRGSMDYKNVICVCNVSCNTFIITLLHDIPILFI